MIALLRKQDSASGASVIGQRFEFQGQFAARPFFDAVSTAIWLRGFELTDLRLALNRFDPGTIVWRMTDNEVIRRVTMLLVSGSLRIGQSGGAVGNPVQRSSSVRGDGVAQGIVDRIHGANTDLSFNESRLRVIRAELWTTLHTQTGRRFEVVDRNSAARLLERMANSLAFSMDRKRAVEEAVPLLGDLTSDQTPETLFVVRYSVQSAVAQKTSAGPVFTPTQLRGSQQKDQVYWVEIELIDASDRPVANEAYTLQLPDGEVRKGTLDAQGRARVGDVKSPGQCKVCFPDIDASEWRAA